MPVLGICNGFQILCESHLLPGALIRNDHRKFGCLDQRLRDREQQDRLDHAYDAGQEVTIVLKNGEGSYVADEHTLDMLEAEGRVVARYLGGNPNGSQRAIAGVTNEAGNVVGLMPHPEHAVEDLCGPGTDGLGFFTSVVAALQPPDASAAHADRSRARPRSARRRLPVAGRPTALLVGRRRALRSRRRRCR